MPPKRQGQMVSDETLLETLTDLYEAGDTLGGGGVPPQRVADELPICSKTVRKRLADLSREGEAEVDWGFRDYKARRGYAPVCEDEEPTRRLITDGGTDRDSDGTYSVRISEGALVVYFEEESDQQVATVRSVDPERELVDVFGVPGVLRMQDIVAVGVYGDEAEFHLDPTGTGGDRITPPAESEADEGGDGQ